MFAEGGWGSGGGKKSMSEKLGWRAWFNAQPSTNGSISTLHILGSINVGNITDSLQLNFAGLEKHNPATLLLQLTYRTILTPREQGDTTVRLHYSQDVPVGQIGSIKIYYPDDEFVEIKFIPIIF